MGLGFLTLGVSIDVVLCPGCLTLSDWCVVRSKDRDVQWFSEHMLGSCGAGFEAKRRACHLGLKLGCLVQVASAWDTGRDG